MAAYQIEHYLTAHDQKNLFIDWLSGLRDVRAKVAIIRRLARMEQGNFGDHRFCRDGVWELRIDAGPGYRLYYAVAGRRLVLLLCGGDKRSQNADIDRATGYWLDWQWRLDE
ncbi:type II toxin-antitoxin system RelE/ParE family toxin [Burkholderia sp. Ac-20379]|uniref:type II toxin-antitoxin system RelE/ParE family toxin n=1 Tax=Burkholderia sp. Ac-20379 TaxID=2703900 RepID=UPI0019802066|nr:type II toxin-antitoxin system RelE/ParE family toxin [Burkholderia sp. Ac-20379]MBN3724030.1 type II toxin-antitoxin system RelE/ParE family toxin [Burkholderia sp. Ac-20379]